MKKFLLLIIIAVTFFDMAAQTVVLERSVTPIDSADNDFGPNQKHFVHNYIGMGVIFGSDEPGASVKFPNSLDFMLGLRYKLKLSNTFSTGFDLEFNSLDYHIKQEPGKMIPDTVLHDKEKITLYNIQANIFGRINFGERGDFMGNFIDLGAGYALNVSRVHSYIDDLPTGERKEVAIHKINFVNKTIPSAFVRFGWNRFIIYGRYRLGEIMKSPYPDLPKLSAGLQIGIH